MSEEQRISPGLEGHEVRPYGQIRIDGWHCKKCIWQDSNYNLSWADAREKHNREILK